MTGISSTSTGIGDSVNLSNQTHPRLRERADSSSLYSTKAITPAVKAFLFFFSFFGLFLSYL